MKANVTCKLKTAIKAIVLSIVVLGIGEKVNAQALTGGSTYYIDGVGTDLVSPKDTFNTLTSIFSVINTYGTDPSTSGTITILLTSRYATNNVVETGQLVLGSATSGAYSSQSSNRPIVLKPVAGTDFTITCSTISTANSSLLRFNGIRFFTIDGEGTSGQKNITFKLPAASSTAIANSLKVIDMIPFSGAGCSDISIQNCNIIGNSTSTVINSYAGVYLGGSGVPTSSNAVSTSQNIKVEGNFIGAVRNGVYMRGLGTTLGKQDQGLIIRGNIIGGQVVPGGSQNTDFIGGIATSNGILLSAQATALVENNVIRNSHPDFGSFRGIAITNDAGNFALDSAITITRNKIYNITTTASSSGSYGIAWKMTAPSHGSLNSIIANNTIANISATAGLSALSGLAYPIGISIEDNSADLGLSIIHNSINLYGNVMGQGNTSTGSVSACLVFSNGVTGGVTLKNNILANRMGRISTNAVGAVAYGIVLNSSNSHPFSASNGNNYYLNAFTGSNAFVGYAFGKNNISVNHWRTVTGDDNSSITAIPPFLSDTLLELTSATPSIISKSGVSGTIVTTDITGNSRSSTAPSIGAYEFTSNASNINGPLVGGSSYSIGGTSSWPVGASTSGTFANMTEAITYLNAYGTQGSDTVKLILTSSYTGEGSNYMPAIIDYPNAASARPVLIKPANNVVDTLTIPNQASFNNCSVLQFLGASYVTLDGNNNSLSLIMPPLANNLNSRVIGITPSSLSSSTNIAIRNCNLLGSTTGSPITAVNTFAGIYLGDYSSASSAVSAQIGFNDNLTLSGNYIQGVRNGIYLKSNGSTGGVQSKNIYVGYNTIGGTTANIGGATGMAGIYIKGIANSTVTGNIVRNNIASLSNDFRGIDIDAAGELSRDSNLVVSKNKIYNLNSTSTGCDGIRVNLANDSLRRIFIVNNFIGKILGIGSSSIFSNTNPIGILIDGTGIVNNIGVEMYYNTVQLSGSTLTTNTGGSSALFVGANIRGGVSMKNNIFINNLGKSTFTNGPTASAFAVSVGSLSGANPFTSGGVSNNIYYAGGDNVNNYIGYGDGGSKMITFTDWKAYTGQDANSNSQNVKFMSDTVPDIDASTAGRVINAASLPTITTTDIYGTIRYPNPGYNISPSNSTPCIGAVEFAQPFSPLVGGNTYNINGIQSPPTKTTPSVGSFATVNRAFQYLIANGVSTSVNSPINLLLTTGYKGEGDTLVVPLTEFPNANASRTVILKTDSVRTITGTLPHANSGSMIRFSGASYFTIDGSKNGTNSRELTITLPLIDTSTTANAFKNNVVDLVPGNLPSRFITVKNCNIQGAVTKTGTITSFAGIYMGGITSTPSDPTMGGNNNNTFANNFIGGVKYGVYLRGTSAARGLQDIGNTIKGNEIGGDIAPASSTYSKPTNYFGGDNQAAGISLLCQAFASVDSNIIKNNVPTFNLNRGIEITTTTGTGVLGSDSGISVTRNSIFKIKSNGATAYGIYVGLGNDTSRAITIANNFISGITSIGTNSTTAISPFNPSGIFIDGVGSVNNLGVNIWFNSISFKGAGITTTNSASSCVQIAPTIKSGISLKNNILQNLMTNPTGGTAAAVVVGNNQSVFSSIDNNNYYVKATGGTSTLMAYNAGATKVLANDLTALTSFTAQDTMSINFFTKFLNDSVLDIDTSITKQSVLVGSGASIPGISKDIFNNNRNFKPTIGAVEFAGTYIDSVAPKVANYSNITCGNGPFKIDVRVYDNSTVYDTLYYAVNGGSPISVLPSTINGTRRVYNIPAQASSSLILYRVAVSDAANFTAKYPPVSTWDSIATSISSLPYGYGFDGPNVNKWTVEQLSGNGTWILDSYGSTSNPNFTSAFSGLKMALFPAATLAQGTSSRIVSPCFDLTNAKNPTLRFWVSQNSDLPNKRDSILVRINDGNGWLTTTKATIMRANSNFTFPGWRQVDVCLADFAGVSGLKVGLEGYSMNGNNMMIDSVIMIDNFINTTVTPTTSTICGKDSIVLNVSNSLSSFSYTMYDINQGTSISVPYVGNGGTLIMKAANPKMDSITVGIQALNNLATDCYNIMDTKPKVYTKLFKNGPFVVQGSPFSGIFNTNDKDGAKQGDTLTYTIVPPSGFTNTDYNNAASGWTITGVTVKTQTGVDASSMSFTAPTPSTDGRVAMKITANDGDSLFYMTVNFRLLPTNCDSAVVRQIKSTSIPAAAFTNGGSDTACQGATVSFVNTTPANPLTSPNTYAWDFGDGTTSTSANVNKIYGVAGQYTVKLTVSNSVGVSGTVSKTFTVSASPVSGFTNTVACMGDSIAFTNTTTGATSYVWNYTSQSGSGSSTDQNPKFLLSTPSGDTATFDFSLVATNNIGCTNTTNKKIQLFIKPVASFSVSSHCLGVAVPIVNNSTITGANTIGSTWYAGNGDVFLSNNPTYRYPNNGTYTIYLKVESNYGCVDMDTQTVTVYDRPRVGFSYDIATTCQGVEVKITDTTKYQGVLGSDKALYLWNFGDFTATSTDFTPTKTYGAAGTYQLKLVAMDTVHFCSDSATKSIKISATPVAQFEAPDGGCIGNQITFTNKTSVIGDALTFDWAFGDGGTSTSTDGMHPYLTSGDKTVVLKATSISGCVDTASKVISISPKPTVSYTKDSVDWNSVRVTATSSTYASYVWDMGDGTTPLTAYRDVVTYTYNNKGWHTIKLTVTDDNGCSSDPHIDSVNTYASVGLNDQAVAQFGLNVYPNPFTDITNINYTLDRANEVSIQVFDLVGRLVADMNYGNQTAGKYTVELNAEKFSASSAAYLVRIQIGDTVITKQIVRQK